MKYNYVIFNTRDDKDPNKNRDGYYTICLQDLKNIEGIHIVSHPFDYTSRITRFVYDFCHSERVNNIIKIPFKKFWFPYYYNKIFTESKPICFIIMDPYISVEYLKYLKTNNNSCKIVAIHRDSVQIWKKSRPQFIQNPIFDLEMTYDPYEAIEYRMSHFNEFESKIDISILNQYPEYDVFFAGKAKDRLQRLLDAYEIFNKYGLNCFFYITGVNHEDRVEKKGIVFADKLMTYREMLKHSVNSRCLLEINQQKLTGYTSRFLEAVMFNKLLISDNQFIKTTKFYKPEYIQVVDNILDIKPDFVLSNISIDYKYKDEFSPKHLISQIEKELA